MPDEIESYAYLRVTSESVPADVISQSLGVIPDRAWSVGDPIDRPRAKQGSVREFSAWSLGSGASEGSSLEAHVRALLDRVRLLAPALSRMRPEISVVVEIVQHLPSQTDAGLHLDAEQIAIIAAAGASVDIDQYVVVPCDDDVQGSAVRND